MHRNLDLVEQVTPIIKQAGAIVLSYFNTPLERAVKPGDQGFVTRADIESERFLIQQLGKIMPEASFYAEESGKTGKGSEYCWVIDPLDGTTNFASGIPYFCISIALTHNNEPVFGMVYQPVTQELFYAIKGQGAYENEKKLTLSDTVLSQAVIALGLPYAKDENYDFLLARTLKISHQVYAIRHFGAAALDAAYVAAGKVQGTYVENLGWWDVAAGIVLIQEAGGLVSTFTGDIVTPEYTSFVAGAPGVHQQLRLLLQ